MKSGRSIRTAAFGPESGPWIVAARPVPPVGTILYHVCQPLEHLIGHSTTKADLFPTSRPNTFRVYVKLGRATSQRLTGSILRRCPEIASDLPLPYQEIMYKGPSLGWDVHSKKIWCVDRSTAESLDPWDSALFGHACLSQGALVCRVMEEGRIRAWDTIMVTYDDPASAPRTGGSAVSLALLVFCAIEKAIDHPGPSLICIPDQRVAEMLTARRTKWGMVGKVSGIIYRECLAVHRPVQSSDTPRFPR